MVQLLSALLGPMRNRAGALLSFCATSRRHRDPACMHGCALGRGTAGPGGASQRTAGRLQLRGEGAGSQAMTVVELARVDGSMSTFLMVHNSLAMLTIGLLGSPQQKASLLPPMARLDYIGARCPHLLHDTGHSWAFTHALRRSAGCGRVSLRRTLLLPLQLPLQHFPGPCSQGTTNVRQLLLVPKCWAERSSALPSRFPLDSAPVYQALSRDARMCLVVP